MIIDMIAERLIVCVGYLKVDSCTDCSVCPVAVGYYFYNKRRKLLFIFNLYVAPNHLEFSVV